MSALAATSAFNRPRPQYVSEYVSQFAYLYAAGLICLSIDVPPQKVQQAMTPLHINSEFAEWVLVWIGFGTLVGLAAKLLSPGRDPGGSIMTLMIGILGTLIGCSVLAFLKQDTSSITPISVQGFPCGVAGAFVLLMTYRLLGGYYFEEGEDGVPLRARRRRRRRYVNYE